MSEMQKWNNMGLDKHHLYRPVSGEWIKEQVAALNGGVVVEDQDLVNKVLDDVQFYFENYGLKGRFVEGSEVIVTSLGNEVFSDYLFVFEEDIRSKKQRFIDNQPEVIEQKPFAINLRQEFEDTLIGLTDYTVEQLHIDVDGKYLDKTVQVLWEGFKLYHEGLSIPSDKLKGRVRGNLGVFFIGEAHKSGSLMFHSRPYRHQTKAAAYEHANHLASTQLKHFAVCRCIDIIPSPVDR